MTDKLMDIPGQVRRQIRAVDIELTSLNQELKILRGLIDELPSAPEPAKAPFYIRWYNWVALNLVNQLPVPR